MLGEASKQEIYNKCSENSRSEIVFRTDIFLKLALGAPDWVFHTQLEPVKTPFHSSNVPSGGKR